MKTAEDLFGPASAFFHSLDLVFRLAASYSRALPLSENEGFRHGLLAQELIDLRHIFLSQYVHRTYNPYVLSQFKKLEQDLRNHGQVRWKHVMHLIRLLLSGVEVLKHGFVPLRVDEYRDRLLAIRRGEAPWEEVERWRLALHRELDAALGSTDLPEHPDYERANEFLVRARRIAALPEYAP